MAVDRPAAPPHRRRILFGRRQGRRLRAAQKTRLDDYLAKIGFAVPSVGGLDPGSLFAGPPDGVWVEIGFGSGEHLAHQASAHPRRGYIGCEPYLNGVARLVTAIDHARLENIRINTGDGRELLAALPALSIAGAFLLFPDPWPKTRHHKRRFVQPETLDHLARILCDGAAFVFATDHMEYLRWTLARVLEHGAFDWPAQGPRDWRRPDDVPATRYEAKAAADGRPSVYLRFIRRPRAQAPDSP